MCNKDCNGHYCCGDYDPFEEMRVVGIEELLKPIHLSDIWTVIYSDGFNGLQYREFDDTDTCAEFLREIDYLDDGVDSDFCVIAVVNGKLTYMID